MHISLPLPHPLARLSHILAALERARAAGAPRVCNEHHGLDLHHEARDDAEGAYRSDMEVLSLSLREPPHERRADDLELMSLEIVEGTTASHHDSLGDVSLERSFPPRPGL